MRILVLGGTAWLGGMIAVAARNGGHDVTCLARGSSPAPEGLALVAADRDAEDGLSAVRGERWDAVIDVSRQPGQVQRAVAELDPSHWVFISSGNVYADPSRLEQDEEAATLAPLAGDVMADMADYGAAKVACESAVRSASAPATIIRSGLIAGPGDWSGRSGYWPWRFAHPTGEDVVVPDDLDFPCAMIDVRDLAAWTVRAAEDGLRGTFNAAGATTQLRDVLSVSAAVAGSSASLLPVPATLLRQLGITGWMGPASLPLWTDDPAWRGFATLNTDRARAAGLARRSLASTLRDALAYEEQRSQPRQAGLSDDDEIQVRRAVTQQ